VERMQCVAYPGVEYKISTYGPSGDGEVVVRDGRITFARCGGLRSEDALNMMVCSPDLKICSHELANPACDNYDEMDTAVDEYLIPFLVSYSSEEDPNDIHFVRTRRIGQYLS
ncbi:MAG: hypothetical protein AAF558_07775, partial [Verrucomicrobiota bacterium]